MLQQTPVARVVPAYEAWLERWPTPAALAADEPGEAVRAWGRLGYPRRALRLHAAACAVVAQHGGELPSSVPALLALPGRRRLHGAGGRRLRLPPARPGRRHQRAAGRRPRRRGRRRRRGQQARPRAVEALLPADPEEAAVASIAFMELGALVCTARAPRCPACPLQDRCAWVRAGSPALDAPVKRPQGYAGTDRQVRGRLLGVLRDAEGRSRPTCWPRCGTSRRSGPGRWTRLVADGLVDPLPDGRYALPSGRAR
jgi:A/G-specific adenine glycosylase